MNLKRLLSTLIVEVLADRTTIVRKSDSTDIWLHALLGVETDEQRMTRSIEESLDQATSAVKRVKINREFKRITENV